MEWDFRCVWFNAFEIYFGIAAMHKQTNAKRVWISHLCKKCYCKVLILLVFCGWHLTTGNFDLLVSPWPRRESIARGEQGIPEVCIYKLIWFSLEEFYKGDAGLGWKKNVFLRSTKSKPAKYSSCLVKVFLFIHFCLHSFTLAGFEVITGVFPDHL